MNRRLAVLVFGAALMLTGRSPGAAPATTRGASPEVESLVAQLSSDDWKVRQTAQDRLVELGDVAAPRLQALARDSEDEEVRTRAEAALRQIEENSKSGPTLVTLHMKNATVVEVLAELSKQAKTEISVWPPMMHQPDQPKVTIDVDRQPFWVAVREFCAKAQYSPMQMGQGRPITLQSASDSWAKAPFVQHQCFFVTADSANRSHQVEFSNPQRIQNNFSVQVRVLVDPKLRVVQGPSMLRVEEAVDERGNSLVQPSSFSEGYNPWGSWIWQLSAPLKYQPNLGTKIKFLRAKARFVIQSKAERWEIEDVLNATDKQKAVATGARIVFKGLSKTGGDVYEAKVIITGGGNVLGLGGRNPLFDPTVLQQGIRLVDAAGRPYSSSGSSSSGGPTGQTTCSFSFSAYSQDGQKPGAPAKLTWDIPLEVKEIVVPIEFKDLPIP